MKTSDLLEAIRADLKHGLREEIMSELKPAIQKMLYANVFTFQEAMKYLKVSESTLRRLIKEKAVPYFKQRECLYFRQTDLDKYIDDAVKRELSRRSS